MANRTVRITNPLTYAGISYALGVTYSLDALLARQFVNAGYAVYTDGTPTPPPPPSGTGTDPEVVRDVIGATLVAGPNISIDVNDPANTITISSTGGGVTDPEVVRDVISAALVAGPNVTITPNDAADTITIASSTDPEVVRDVMGVALVAGPNVTITPNDAADTITIASTATAAPGPTLIAVSSLPLTLAAAHIGNLVWVTSPIDGQIQVPLGTSLSLASWPAARWVDIINAGPGVVAISALTGILSSPAVRDVSTLSRDWVDVGVDPHGIDYVVPHPTTATGDVLLCAISRDDAYANWAMPAGWVMITTPDGGMTGGGPSGSGCYLFARYDVTGNLAGTSATFTAQFSDGRPAACAMISISGADTSAPIGGYVQTPATGYDGATAPPITAPSTLGNYLELDFVYSANAGSANDAPYTAPTGTTAVASVSAGSVAPFVRLGAARNPALVAAGAAVGGRVFSPGGYGGGFTVLIRPTSTGATIIALDDAYRLLARGSAARLVRGGLNTWALIGSTDV